MKINREKANQQFRKALEIMSECEKKSEDTNLSYEEFYLNALNYEFAYSFALLNYSLFLDSGDTSNSLLFLRRHFECVAYYTPVYSKLFEKINYQVYKIQAQKREVGEKEGLKLKHALKLKKCDMNDAIKNNNFLFLHGVFSEQFTYRNFVSNLFNMKDEAMKYVYDYLSLRIHQTNLNLFNGNFKTLDTRLLESCKRYSPDFFISDLKRIKKLNKTSLFDVEKSLLLDNDYLVLTFLNNIIIFINSINSTEFNYFCDFVKLVWDFLYSSLMLLKMNSYRAIVATFKPFVEKVAVLNNLLKMKPSDANEAFVEYNFCSMYVLNNTITEMGITSENYYSEHFESIYKNHAKKNKNLSMTSFRIKVENNPSFVITNRVENYSASVERFFKENYAEDQQELMEAYFESVVLSHCDAFLLFKKEKDYSFYAKILLNFTFECLKYLINYFYGNKFNVLLDSESADSGYYISEKFIELLDKIKDSFLKNEEIKEENKEHLKVKNIEDYLD